jgi:hypothetical protein
MTQKIIVGGPSPDFATLSAALASLVPAVPFVEPIVLEVHADSPTEAIVVPSTLLPTAANPLIIFALRQTNPPAVLAPVQSLSGSFALYGPPDPRHIKPVMDSFDLQAEHTTLNGFQVNGDIVVSADNGTTVFGNLVEEGQIRLSRGVVTPITNSLIASNEIRMGELQSGILIKNVTMLKLYHNTVLQRRFDAANMTNPSYGLEVEDCQIDIQNNLVSAQGTNAFALRFIGNPALNTIDWNFYASFEGALRFSFGPDAATVTETDNLNEWQAASAQEANSLFGDPEFRERTTPTGVDLDVSNTSDTMAAAPALQDVRHDVRSERRPVDFVTIGAHEHAEVITENGQKRFLELLSGLSTDPVTKGVLGESEEATLFTDFPAQLATDNDVDEIFSPVDLEPAVAPGTPGREGEVFFHAAFQVDDVIYGELLDAEFDRANEVGLLSADNNVFMVKRMKSIPFDSTGFMHTQFKIPVEIVETVS